MADTTPKRRSVVGFLIRAVGPVFVLIAGLQAYSWIGGGPSPTVQNVTDPLAPLAVAPSTQHAGAHTVLESLPEGQRYHDIAALGADLLVVSTAAGGSLRIYSAPNFVDITDVARESYSGEMRNVWADPVNGAAFVGATHEPGIAVIQVARRGGTFVATSRALTRPDSASISWLVKPAERWLGTGFLTDGLLYELAETGDGDLTVTGRKGGPLFPDVVGPIARALLSSNTAAMAPNGRIAQVFQYSPRIHVYDSTGRLIRAIAGPVEVPLFVRRVFDKKDNQEEINPTGQTKFSYVDVAVNDDMIVALFAGRMQQVFKDLFVAGQQVHVFSWDGELRSVIELDAPAFRIAVSAQRLWATIDRNTRLVEYPLPFEAAASDKAAARQKTRQ